METEFKSLHILSKHNQALINFLAFTSLSYLHFSFLVANWRSQKELCDLPGHNESIHVNRHKVLPGVRSLTWMVAKFGMCC